VAGQWMVWPDFRSFCDWFSQRGIYGTFDGLGGIVRSDYICDAVNRAKDQRQDTDNDQHYVPKCHPDGHVVPVCGKLYENGHDDAEKRKTKGTDESNEWSDSRYSHGNQHCEIQPHKRYITIIKI